jgi:hypothetical protein
MTIKADTPILTASGWMLANTVRPGDIVFGQDGSPKTVTSVQAFDKGHTHEVLLDDGLTICGGPNMRLVIEKMNAAIAWLWRRPIAKIYSSMKAMSEHSKNRIIDRRSPFA